MHFTKAILPFVLAAPTPDGDTNNSVNLNNGSGNPKVGEGSDAKENQQTGLGTGGHTMSNLQCKNPSGGAGTSTAKATKVNELANQLEDDKDYCVDSDGSDVATGKGNWSLVDGRCGADSTAIWLQSYVIGFFCYDCARADDTPQNTGNWCLKGAVIKEFAKQIVFGCRSNAEDLVWGSVVVDGAQQWVEVGKSADCNPHG
ncbi:MAG: hypothetical protein Q9221_007445 [Calogaya cf. arnoldii]